jgi:hypothetical protein
MLDQQKSDVWLRDANIETGGGREDGKNVSRLKWYITTECMHVKTIDCPNLYCQRL